MGDTDLTLVLTAMPREEAAVIDSLAGARIESRPSPAGSPLFLIPDRRLALARVEVGPIAAALNLGLILSQLTPVSRILLMGVGGALDPALLPGDLVVATGVIQHDARYDGDNEVGLMRAGELFVSLPRDERPSPLFETDSHWSRQICERLSMDGVGFRTGVIVSGSSFCGTHTAKERLRAVWPNATLVDMEAIAVAFAASRLGIPFVVAKTVADRFGKAHNSETDYLDFVDASCRNAAELVKIL